MKIETGTPPADGRYVVFVRCEARQVNEWAEPIIAAWHGTFRKDRPTIRQLWEQVCEGNYESAVPEGKEDRCGSCTD